MAEKKQAPRHACPAARASLYCALALYAACFGVSPAAAARQCENALSPGSVCAAECKPGRIALPENALSAPARAARPAARISGPGDAAGAQAPAQESETGERAQGGAARVRLFGTVEFRSKLKDMPRWTRVITEEGKKSGLDSPGGLAASWPAVREKLASRPAMEQLAGVNSFFNRFPYRLDMEAYGVLDYWATTGEFAARSGDCEDYAISKYYALRQLGVPPDRMRIVVVMDSIRNLAHAVLAVYMDGTALILDNVSNLILPHTRLTHYKPQFSVNENNRWVHPAPKK